MELGSRVKISSEGSSLGRGVVDGLGNGLANDMESQGRGLDNLAYCHKVMIFIDSIDFIKQFNNILILL